MICGIGAKEVKEESNLTKEYCNTGNVERQSNLLNNKRHRHLFKEYDC